MILFGESSAWQHRLVPVQFLVNSTTSSKASFSPNYPGFRKTIMSTEAATVPCPHPIIIVSKFTASFQDDRDSFASDFSAHDPLLLPTHFANNLQVMFRIKLHPCLWIALLTSPDIQPKLQRQLPPFSIDSSNSWLLLPGMSSSGQKDGPSHS